MFHSKEVTNWPSGFFLRAIEKTEGAMASKSNRYSELSWRQKRKRTAQVERNRLVALDTTDSNDSNELDQHHIQSESNESLQPHAESDSDDSSNNSHPASRSTEDSSSELSFDDAATVANPEPVAGSINNRVTDANENSDASTEIEENNEAEVLPNQFLQGRLTLRNKCLSVNLNHVQVKRLLRTLRNAPFNLHYLPKDPRTLLETPTVVVKNIVQNVAGDRYLHFGFKLLLQRKLESVPDNLLPDRIEIDFSTDGGRVFKSTLQQFWPIQFRIFNVAPKKPIIAGCYLGHKKPSNAFDFLNPLVTEVVELIEQGGIDVRGRLLPLHIRCFIADAPARAFVLNHYGHNAPYACSKCKVEGHYSSVPNFERTRVFTGKGRQERTDDEYRAVLDEDHHKGPSPLSRIMGLVTQVPFEVMHLIYIGVLKRLLEAQINGSYGFRRLNARKMNILDSRLSSLECYCPSEFNRRPLKLSLFNLYKATMFRQLLLYTCPAVFCDVFSPPYYLHFVLLHFIIRILSAKNIQDDLLVYCKNAMVIFIEGSEELYKENIMSYNLHGLLHVVDDVQKLGNIESYSAFCYENNMREFTSQIRKPGTLLEQYYNRFHIKNNLALVHEIDDHRNASEQHVEGPLLDLLHARRCVQFKK